MTLQNNSFWRVRSSVMSDAASVLGDEFSVLGVAVTLALPRHEVAQALSQMAAAGWIGRIASCQSRNPLHGPWYEPRPKWQELAARRFSFFAREIEVDLALAAALEVARSRNRNWRMFDGLVTELWARSAPVRATPHRAMSVELAVACCVRPGRPVRPLTSLEPHSTAWGEARAAFKASNSSLTARDLPTVAVSMRLQPLYRACTDFDLWFSTPETVQEFPTAFLACAKEWSASPEHFVDLRRFASAREVEQLRVVALETAASTADGS